MSDEELPRERERFWREWADAFIPRNEEELQRERERFVDEMVADPAVATRPGRFFPRLEELAAVELLRRRLRRPPPVDDGEGTDYDEIDDGFNPEGLPEPPMNRPPNAIRDGRDLDDVDTEETAPEQRGRVFDAPDREAPDTDDTGGDKSDDEENVRRTNLFAIPQASRRARPPSQLKKYSVFNI